MIKLILGILPLSENLGEQCEYLLGGGGKGFELRSWGQSLSHVGSVGVGLSRWKEHVGDTYG